MPQDVADGKMKEALATHAEYHRGLEPKFNKVTLDDLDGHDELPFSSIEDIARVIEQLSGEMGARRQKDKNAELKVLELQSRMLKSQSDQYHVDVGEMLMSSRHESQTS